VTTTVATEDREQKFYFEDLPTDLQEVLRAQLRQVGDVSAVIETSSAFLLYLTIEKTGESLRAAGFTVHKRAYDEWLGQQPDENP
jgi:hypothetical protein